MQPGCAISSHAGYGPDGGQWTGGSVAGGAGSANPMGGFDIGDLSDPLGLFDITPRDDTVEGIMLAGDPPVGIALKDRLTTRRRFRPSGQVRAPNGQATFERQPIGWLETQVLPQISIPAR